jgi:FkbM family methyltransferase
MNIFAYISKLLPEGKVKTSLRNIYNSLIIYIPLSIKTETFNGIEIKMYQYPLLHYPVDINVLKGYTKNKDIKKGMIVIDVGAFDGTFTIYASKKAGDTGEVIAYEPDNFAYKMLLRNIRLNNLSNVSVIKRGIYNQEGKKLFINSFWDSRISHDNTRNLKHIEVSTLDLEMERLYLSRVDFVKMDIEGAELEAIQTMKKLLKFKPYFAIASYHFVDGKQTYMTLAPFFKKQGYIVKTEYEEHLTTYAGVRK